MTRGTGLAPTEASPSLCTNCGILLDAKYFDESGLRTAPKPGSEVVLARFDLPPQYCGVLEYFSQFTDAYASDPLQIDTPGLEWRILSNDRPLYPYITLDRIANPWGYGSFPFAIRLEENATIEFVVRRIGSTGASAMRSSGVPFSTTIGSSITANLSPQLVTPASLAGIKLGAELLVGTAPNQETVVVISVLPPSFAAVFKKNHATPPISVSGIWNAITKVGGRIMGRYWYNPAYGDVERRRS